MGAGTRRLQIVVSESFEPMLCWEIRTDATIDVNGNHVDGTVVYESIGISPESERVAGYRRLHIAAEELDRLVEWYSEIAVPLQIPQTDYAVLDGTTHQVALFSTIGNSLRFRWREGEAPAGWAEMVRTTSRAVAILRQLRDSSNEV